MESQLYGVDTLAKSHIRKTTSAAAEYAERLKAEKYVGLSGQYEFYPVGIEAFGSWGPSVLDTLEQIGKRIKEHTGGLRTMDYLRQKNSIEIQRRNAVSAITKF